jgi:hypothetical protein
MRPPRARETTLAGRPGAKHGVADIDRLAGNAVWAHNDAIPLIFNDADHWLFVSVACLSPTSAARRNELQWAKP